MNLPSHQQQKIKNKIIEIDALCNSLSGVIIIYHISDGWITLSPNGLQLLGQG